MSTTSTILRGSVAVLAAAGLAAGTGLAGAQIPGGNTGGNVVKTDSNDLLVTVNDTAPNASQVTGSIENSTGNNFRCGVPAGDGEELPGQATTAQVVSLAMDYYTRSIYSGGDGFDIPMVGELNTGSLDDILPSGGSSGIGGSSEAGDDVTTAQQAARVDGRTGDPLVGGNSAFNVNASQTVNWTASMTVSSTGNRGEWQAAAMFYCIDQVTEEHYVFAGYEGLEPGESPDPVESDSGSLAAGSLGS